MKTKQSLIYIALITGSIFSVPQAVKAAAIVEVPFIWTIEPADFNLPSFTSIENYGGPGFSNDNFDRQESSLTISFIHNAPVGYTRLDPLPTTVTLNFAATFSGQLENTTFGGNATAGGGFGFIDSGFFNFPQVVLDTTGTQPFNEQEIIPIEVGQGQINLYSFAAVNTLFGSYSVEECPPQQFYCDYVAGLAQLQLTAELVNPVQTIRYAIPEPLTIFGVGTAIGLGTFFKQIKYNKKR